MSQLAVILTCHPPYLRWLPAALASIDSQLPTDAERVLVCDGCTPPAGSAAGWHVISGEWGLAPATRNAGMRVSSAPWLVFWDADNLMADGYIAALLQTISRLPANVAIVYPDVQFCDEHMQPRQFWALPTWEYWGLRAENCIDTASAWRRDALELAGGWSETRDQLDDYSCALRITALGWHAVKLAGPPVLMRRHPHSIMRQRISNGTLLSDIWRSRSLAVVALLAGRTALFPRWLHFLQHAELPPRTALYVVDNSGRPEFRRMAFAACTELAATRGFTHVDFTSSGRPYQPGPAETYLNQARHRHVAGLYAALLPRVGEDLVLTLEDDILPPLDAARRLGAAIGYRSSGKVGVVGAAYAMPHHPTTEVCAGCGDGQWYATIRWEQLSAEPCDVGFVGGGCTVWANWALHDCPVHLDWTATLGWDGVLCRSLRRNGYAVRLHGGVRCLHELTGRTNGV